MHDMLVKLYDLPEADPLIKSLKDEGMEIRTALHDERHRVVEWVQNLFGGLWADECSVSFDNQPVSCFIALHGKDIIGFACFDSSFKNFFGPAGVSEEKRGIGIGKALFLSCLHKMAANGYAYAIIGGVGPSDFYRKISGAVAIEGSSPAAYRNQLKKKRSKKSV
jgi:Acetyltransferase (GNAT) family